MHLILCTNVAKIKTIQVTNGIWLRKEINAKRNINYGMHHRHARIIQNILLLLLLKSVIHKTHLKIFTTNDVDDRELNFLDKCKF